MSRGQQRRTESVVSKLAQGDNFDAVVSRDQCRKRKRRFDSIASYGSNKVLFAKQEDVLVTDWIRSGTGDACGVGDHKKVAATKPAGNRRLWLF
jgi:hypothetical protein